MANNLLTDAANFLDLFFKAYAYAALWSTSNEGPHSTSEMLDGQYSIDDLCPATYMEMMRDCTAFLSKLFEQTFTERERSEFDPQRIGHDFWLTRNGHGAGFWDREELRECGLGNRLTDLAHTFGSYEGIGPSDDGKKVTR